MKELHQIVQESVELFIEKGADLEHDRWARWQKYLHSLCTIELKDGEFVETGRLIIEADRVKHWERQIATPYSELTEKEKEYDRIETRNYIPLLISSQISLLEAELERKKGMMKEGNAYSKRNERQVLWTDIGYNQAIQEDITYLQDQITKCRELMK